MRKFRIVRGREVLAEVTSKVVIVDLLRGMLAQLSDARREEPRLEEYKADLTAFDNNESSSWQVI